MPILLYTLPALPVATPGGGLAFQISQAAAVALQRMMGGPSGQLGPANVNELLSMAAANAVDAELVLVTKAIEEHGSVHARLI
jgi:hypothetical protein